MMVHPKEQSPPDPWESHPVKGQISQAGTSMSAALMEVAALGE